MRKPLPLNIENSWKDARARNIMQLRQWIFLFMARMLFFLPDKHRKMLRYYGIYAHNIDKKLEEVDRSTWVKAVEHSFEKNPEICSNCSALMIKDVVFSFLADKEIKKLVKTHGIEQGYFIPYSKARPP